MSAGELGRPMRLAAPRTRLRVSFGQALALSLALHAALAAPFGLATLWPARDAQDDEALVVEMDGLLGDSQTDAKQAEAEQTPTPPEPPAPQTPPAAQQADPKPADAETGTPATAEATSAPPQQPAPTEAAVPIAAPPPQPARLADDGQAAQTISREAPDDADALRRYGAQLAKKVQARLIYPPEARASRAQGVVKVAFALAADGAIAPGSLRIVASSGNPTLDEAALATLRAGAPYPPPPKPTSIAFALAFGGKNKQH